MPLRVGKLHDLILDRGAVARAARRDCAAVHRGLRNVFLDDALAFRLEVRDPARHLCRMPNSVSTASLRGPEVRPGIVELFDLALLDFQCGIVDGASIDPRWSSGLEPGDDQSGLL